MELELTDSQVFNMILESSRHVGGVDGFSIRVCKSVSYGTHMHRTWVFSSPQAEVVGTIERYWGGLKMICSVFGCSPRTNFFTEDGQRTTTKGLKNTAQ